MNIGWWRNRPCADVMIDPGDLEVSGKVCPRGRSGDIEHHHGSLDVGENGTDVLGFGRVQSDIPGAELGAYHRGGTKAIPVYVVDHLERRTDLTHNHLRQATALVGSIPESSVFLEVREILTLPTVHRFLC